MSKQLVKNFFKRVGLRSGMYLIGFKQTRLGALVFWTLKELSGVSVSSPLEAPKRPDTVVSTKGSEHVAANPREQLQLVEP